jgi:hypothetical protein
VEPAATGVRELPELVPPQPLLGLEQRVGVDQRLVDRQAGRVESLHQGQGLDESQHRSARNRPPHRRLIPAARDHPTDRIGRHRVGFDAARTVRHREQLRSGRDLGQPRRDDR